MWLFTWLFLCVPAALCSLLLCWLGALRARSTPSCASPLCASCCRCRRVWRCRALSTSREESCECEVRRFAFALSHPQCQCRSMSLPLALSALALVARRSSEFRTRTIKLNKNYAAERGFLFAKKQTGAAVEGDRYLLSTICGV